eukprot:1331674-Pyramimonas_sp.AAC.1
MQQADAPDVSESIPVITSPAAPLTDRVKCRKPAAPLKITRTNSFAGLARAADRVQSSERDRRTRLMSPNRFQ